jgi:hypothetical protein
MTKVKETPLTAVALQGAPALGWERRVAGLFLRGASLAATLPRIAVGTIPKEMPGEALSPGRTSFNRLQFELAD